MNAAPSTPSCPYSLWRSARMTVFARHAPLALLTAGLLGCEPSPATSPDEASALSVSLKAYASVGSRSILSSTTVDVRWQAPARGVPAQYLVVASERDGTPWVRSIVPGTSAATTLTGLKSATAYTIWVKTCSEATCSTPSAGSSAPITTAEEVWQFQGSGRSVQSLSKLVSDGNARLSVTRFGPEAGATANRLQLYYGPLPPMGNMSQSLAVATTTTTTQANDPGSYLSFMSLAGSSGISSDNATAAPLVGSAGIGAGQGVPLASGSVRLVFEARGLDNKTRIMAVDSKDGYTGRDFNSGAATTCLLTADYSAGGGCEPTVLIGVEGDSLRGNPKIKNARQMKLGWPTQDNWRWDGAVGRFMVFTTDSVDGCSAMAPNHAYAQWDGSAWKVQYSGTGCPKLFTQAQAMFPMHVGGVRYKMYYGDKTRLTGMIAGSRLPFLGPKQVIYADGSKTGDATAVDFEDWEAQSTSRNVVFLWPDGSELDAAAEGYIDDYHFLAPTGDLGLQVLYVAITDGMVMPTAAAAVLLNP